MNLSRFLKQKREALGFTQARLSQESGVSIPNIQKIELGVGNPSWSTLQKIATSLGYQMSFSPLSFSWDELAQLGVPISTKKDVPVEKNVENLCHLLKLACLKLSEEDPHSREKDAVSATLLALRTHFPALHKKHFAKVKVFQKFTPEKPSGRQIKLRRLAIASLAAYL